MTLIIDNISALELRPLTAPLTWQVRFRSTNAGCHHQLYINGRLADVTDTPQQRAFDVVADVTAQELAVVAVPARYRHRNLAAQLPAHASRPPWVYPLRLPLNTAHRPSETLNVYHDSATGLLANEPALRQPLWPPSSTPWGFAADGFGQGGFGLDASTAPGLSGAFGLGPFGIDRGCLALDVPLHTDGLHQLELRTAASSGEESQPVTTTFTAAPPPSPVAGLAVTAYEPGHHTLTLQINRG
jgi:hypothetical protein